MSLGFDQVNQVLGGLWDIEEKGLESIRVGLWDLIKVTPFNSPSPPSPPPLAADIPSLASIRAVMPDVCVLTALYL